ncbi:MAG: lytic transglycosylase domain-containing protein [bacterium]
MRRNVLYITSGLCILAVLLYTGWLWAVLRPVIHKDIINKYAGEYKLDPLLIMAIVKTESNFARKARSHKGAVGLMQLLPSTAQEMADELQMNELEIKDLEKPEVNIRLGNHYLSKLKQETNGDYVQMLAAYNAGFQNMISWRNKDGMLPIENIEFIETRAYVRRVLKTHRILKRFQKIKQLIEH